MIATHRKSNREDILAILLDWQVICGKCSAETPHQRTKGPWMNEKKKDKDLTDYS